MLPRSSNIRRGNLGIHAASRCQQIRSLRLPVKTSPAAHAVLAKIPFWGTPPFIGFAWKRRRKKFGITASSFLPRKRLINQVGCLRSQQALSALAMLRRNMLLTEVEVGGIFNRNRHFFILLRRRKVQVISCLLCRVFLCQ